MRASVFGRLNVEGSSFGLRLGQLIAAVALLYALNCLLSAASYVKDYLAARSWTQVPATVTEVTFDKPVDSEETPPWLTVRYRYHWLDQEFEGDRLTLAGSHYSLKTLLQDSTHQLVESLASKASVDCYVDPDLPTNSVLNRDFFVTVLASRLAIFSIVSFLGGLTLIVMTTELNARKRKDKFRVSSTDEPWRWRADWEAGKIRSVSRIDSRILVGFAVFYLIVIFPLGLLVIREHGGKIISFSGITLIVLGWGAVNLIRMRLWSQRRLDYCEFQLAGQTGIIGGPLYGSIKMPAKKPSGTLLRLSLECVELKVIDNRNSQEDARIESKVVWRDTKLLKKTLRSDVPGSILVPVYFVIPFDCPSSQPDGSPSVHWHLKIGPDGGEGLAEYALFEVPVFKTPDSSPDFEANQEIMEEYEVPIELQTLLKRAGCNWYQDKNETFVEFSLYRPIHLFYGLAFLSALGLIAAVLFFFSLAVWSIVPGIVAVLVIFSLSEMFLWRSRVKVKGNELTASAGILGFRKRLDVTLDQIVGIDSAVEYVMSEQSAYMLQLTAHIPVEVEEDPIDKGDHDEDDEDDYDIKQLVIVRRLSSEREAKMLGDWLTEQLGLSCRTTSGASDRR